MAEVDACQAEYAAAHPGSIVTRLDIPTFRVFGADWSPRARRRELRAGLRGSRAPGRLDGRAPIDPHGA